ncbi:hypothetical protein EYF80_008558 [Liparis tanakae]|uniref:Uncharacterized protein n=1 Tax=Liparis tanakae TaxID=230148 RepID=A0A4Z2IUM3_9TELE|nr:hypothetical protein EYF80_008558 [Liparis tanakae]
MALPHWATVAIKLTGSAQPQQADQEAGQAASDLACSVGMSHWEDEGGRPWQVLMAWLNNDSGRLCQRSLSKAQSQPETPSLFKHLHTAILCLRGQSHAVGMAVGDAAASHTKEVTITFRLDGRECGVGGRRAAGTIDIGHK